VVKTVISREPGSYPGRHLAAWRVRAGISQKRSGDPVIDFATMEGRLIDGLAGVHETTLATVVKQVCVLTGQHHKITKLSPASKTKRSESSYFLFGTTTVERT